MNSIPTFRRSRTLPLLAAAPVLLGGSAAQAQTAARPAADFTNSIGVNAHIDFTTTAYGNLQNVINAVNYLGVKQIRDCPQNANDLTWWQQVHNATGAKFNAYIGEVGSSGYDATMTKMWQLDDAGLLISVEGGNEPDQPYAIAQGDSMALAAQKQQTLYATGHARGLPVIQTSFGIVADYGSQGDQTAYADYANAHTYFGTGNNPGGGTWIATMNGKALLSTSGKPVIATESGYYTTPSTTDPHNVTEAVQGKYILDLLFDMFKANEDKVYLYELLDQQTGNASSEKNFGLFHSDGTPKSAATGVHNLLSLLADSGTAAPASLSYTLSGMPSSASSQLLNKSDGTFWLAVWNDVRLSGPTSPTPIIVPPVNVGLSLTSSARTLAVYDPLVGTSAVQTVSNSASLTFSLPDHPVLIQITPAPVWNPVLSNPTSITVTGNTAQIQGVVLTDPTAQNSPGSLALNVTTASGTVAMTGAGGTPVTGSGTTGIHISTTFTQLNADLATLTYTFPSGVNQGTVTVNVWDQGGTSTTKNITVTKPTWNPVLSDPTTITISGNQAIIQGVTLTDPQAQNSPGSLALNVTTANGTVAMTGAGGTPVTGSGTGAIHISTTFTQLNADLATLTYTFPSGVTQGTVTVNVWDQGGASTTKNIVVSMP